MPMLSDLSHLNFCEFGYRFIFGIACFVNYIFVSPPYMLLFLVFGFFQSIRYLTTLLRSEHIHSSERTPSHFNCVYINIIPVEHSRLCYCREVRKRLPHAPICCQLRGISSLIIGMENVSSQVGSGRCNNLQIWENQGLRRKAGKPRIIQCTHEWWWTKRKTKQTHEHSTFHTFCVVRINEHTEFWDCMMKNWRIIWWKWLCGDIKAKVPLFLRFLGVYIAQISQLREQNKNFAWKPEYCYHASICGNVRKCSIYSKYIFTNIVNFIYKN